MRTSVGVWHEWLQPHHTLQMTRKDGQDGLCMANACASATTRRLRDTGTRTSHALCALRACAQGLPQPRSSAGPATPMTQDSLIEQVLGRSGAAQTGRTSGKTAMSKQSSE